MPNLASFEQSHPDISLRLAPSYNVIDLDVVSDIDLAIRLGRGYWPNLHSLQVTEDELIPVCSPNIANNKSELSHQVIRMRKRDMW